MNSCFAAFNTPLFVCLIVGFFSKKTPAFMPKIVIPVHVVLYCVLNFGLRRVIPALADIHYLYFTAALFVFDMILVCIITKVRPRETNYELRDSKAVDMTPGKAEKWSPPSYCASWLQPISYSPRSCSEHKLLPASWQKAAE